MIVSSRAVNSRSPVSTASSRPSSSPRAVIRADTRAGETGPEASWAGDVAVSGRSRGSPAKIATVARGTSTSARAASTVSCRISSTVSELLSATEASASARSCSTCSCSSRATSWTSW